ncbi:hypothetical protein Tco_0196986, partial [Tanacetum coccineum]
WKLRWGSATALRGNGESRSTRHPAVNSSSVTIERKKAEDVDIEACSH